MALVEHTVEHPLPRLWHLEDIGQQLLGVEDLHPSVAHHRDERVVFLLGPLDPDHVVKQQLLGVRRRQPRVLEAGPVHDHLAQRSDLRLDAKGHGSFKLLGHRVPSFLRS